MLTLNNITHKDYFSHLSVTIGDCCLLCIKGSDIAKSSLLKIISTLEKPDQGEILYANEQVTGKHHKEYCDIIQYIGIETALKDDLTVKENLEFWASLKGNVKVLLPAALSFFELDEHQDTLVKKLEPNILQRVNLAKLLTRKAEIWLLDEPYRNLDDHGRFLLDGLIRARVEQGGAVIIAANEHLKLENQYIVNLEEFCR